MRFSAKCAGPYALALATFATFAPARKAKGPHGSRAFFMRRFVGPTPARILAAQIVGRRRPLRQFTRCKPAAVVRSIAKWLASRLATAAQRDLGLIRVRRKLVAILIDDARGPLDDQRTIRANANRDGHCAAAVQEGRAAREDQKGVLYSPSIELRGKKITRILPDGDPPSTSFGCSF